MHTLLHWYIIRLYTFSNGINLIIVHANQRHFSFRSDEKYIILQTRQEFSCDDNSDCYPNATVPSSLVECFSGVCRCMECFELGSDGRCTIEFPTCYFYDSGTLSCQDDRRSQLVAFLLSLFLSGVGAANFYVGQTGLAVGQLVLFLAVFLISCAFICIPCCLFCCVAGDEAKVSFALEQYILIQL